MANEYGVTPDSFRAKTAAEILAEIEADQLANVSAGLDVSADSPLGQLNRVYARQIEKLWQEAEQIYHGFDLDKATPAQIESLAKMLGVRRRRAEHSTVLATVSLEEGAELEAGVHFAHVAGKPDVRFTPLEDFVSPSNGTHQVVFRAENTGPVQAPAGTLTVIVTSVVGWASITNALDASLGRETESPAELVERFQDAAAAHGATTLPALRADLRAVQGVRAVFLFENDTQNTVDGRPPNSYEALISDNGEADDEQIGRAILKNKPTGIKPFGTLSVSVEDEDGIEQTVRFSRAEEREVYLSYTLDLLPGADTTGLAAWLAEQANSSFGVGQNVAAVGLHVLPLKWPGVRDVPDFRLGFGPAPSGTTSLTIGEREIAVFDSSRITVAP